MTSDLDIYRTANVLIREHGEDADVCFLADYVRSPPGADLPDGVAEGPFLTPRRHWPRLI
jgi:hypothetical protein